MAERGRPRVNLKYNTIKVEIEQNHLSIQQVAKKYGVSDDTIRRRLAEGAKGSKSRKSKDKPKKEKPTDGRQWLMSHHDDRGKLRFHYNKEDDRYITYLKTSPEPLVVDGATHRALCKAYSNWDGHPGTINEICRTFNMPRPWLIEYLRVHGITHDKEPFSNEDVLERDKGELTEDALQFRRMALYQEYEAAKWNDIKKESKAYRDLQFTQRPYVEKIDMFFKAYKVPRLALPSAKMPYAFVLGLFDIHYGKGVYVLGDGTKFYDRATCRQYVLDSTKRQLAQTVAAYGRPEKIIIPVGNDGFHVDTKFNTTTNGTPQDVDGTPEMIYVEGCQLWVDVVDMCRQVAPVELVLCAGNHDWMMSIGLIGHLYAWFRNQKDVKVHLSVDARNYIEYGQTILGFTHGNDVRAADLGQTMAGEQREAWGRTKFRAFFTGHLHHEVLREIGGILHYVVPSLTPADRWHKNKAYVLSRQAMTGYVISKEFGPKCTFVELAEETGTHGIKMKTRAR